MVDLSGVKILRCIDCGKCTAVCPVARYNEATADLTGQQDQVTLFNRILHAGQSFAVALTQEQETRIRSLAEGPLLCRRFRIIF